MSSIGPEHLELVGTVERVAEANAEAIVALPPGGIAVVPTDAPELEPYLSRSDIEIRRFDRAGSRGEGHEWTFPLPGGEITPDAAVHGAPHGREHARRTRAYEALGLPLEQAQEGADAIVLSRWRGEELPLPGGGIVVNDAYNANPTSMRAALVDLAARAGGRRRVAILGEMAELGETAPVYHERGRRAPGRARRSSSSSRSARVRVRTWAGRPRRRAAGFPARRRSTTWRACSNHGDAILVKASRAVGLEGIPASIEKRARAWSES